MKLSIIVPVYNTEILLPMCVESLLNQKVSNYEIILVNDCSSDGSLDMMHTLEKRHPSIIKIIDSPINLGVGGARNLGIIAAKGEYVAFVDSDDWVKEGSYSDILEKAIDGVDIIYCPNHNLASTRNLVNGAKLVKYSVPGIEGALDNEKRKKLIIDCPSIWDIIYRKGLLIENKILFYEKLFYEDYPFIHQVLFEAKTIACCTINYYYYYQNPISFTRRKNDKKFYDRFKSANFMYEYCISNNKLREYYNEIEYTYVKNVYINGRRVAVSHFTPPNIPFMKMAKKNAFEKFPKFRSNIYYVNKYHWKRRLLNRIADFFPTLFIFITNIYEKRFGKGKQLSISSVANVDGN